MYEKLYDGVPLCDVPAIMDADVTPRGSTALYDAIASGIRDTAKRIAHMDTRPEKVRLSETLLAYYPCR